ncbi:hypothetical protein E4T48_05398 [Aureobasidium sp. EXF-10727]|nr:hypothetical protein E4T48_05398 [Aureobasidium sp. EXF-10727]
MSFPTNHWPFDGTSFNFLPWNHNPASDDNSQPQQQPINPPTPRYLPYPPPQPSSSSSSPYPRLPLPHFAQSRPHSTAAQPRPQQHSTPSASLHAALREGADFLPRPSIVPRLPPLSRVNSASNQPSSFGYIPNHFFYSPPQSPQDSDPPHHTTTNPTRQPAASSSTQPFAGPSFTNHSVGPSVANPLAHSQSINNTASRFDTERMASAFRSEQSQSQYQNPTHPQHVKEESPNTMPASTSTAASSRKRARPTDLGSPPSATKRRLKPAPASAPIELDDTDEDEIEELGPDNDILAKEREALVTKQREESNKVSRIGELNCMICLEHFTNMTATHCGHIFCHECLTQALVASQRNSDHNYGTCPACRKPIKPKGKTQIVPLSLMKARKK